jgi:hypothetical protein
MTNTLAKMKKSRQMRKVVHRSVFLVSLLTLLIALSAGFSHAQSRAPKSLQGKVLDNSEAPLAGAIVYLQDARTSAIRSFISTDDGSYRFGQLASDTDYQVWAQYKGAKSPTKTISSYDSRKQVVIDLHIKTK